MGIEKIPIRVPAIWDPAWFRDVFVAEFLSRLDTRNSVGVGVSVSSTGNSVATLDVSTTITDEIEAHDALVTAHAVAFAAHNDDPAAHSTTIAQAFTDFDAPSDGLEYVRRDATWIPNTAVRLNDNTYLALNDGSYLLLN